MTGSLPMLMQASAVAIGGRAVLLTGEPGAGKSSLALALIDRGAVLIGDDGVTLTAKSGTLFATPPPNIGGLLEVRGVGLIRMKTAQAPVGLLVSLAGDDAAKAERLPDKLPDTQLSEIAVPTLHISRPDWTSTMRIERALEMHGLA